MWVLEKRTELSSYREVHLRPEENLASCAVRWDGAVISCLSMVVFTGGWGMGTHAVGIVTNSIVILFLTCLLLFLQDSQGSDVGCSNVFVHQVAELLYVNVPFASMWVLGITSFIIIKGNAMVFFFFIILHCSGDWTQNLVHTRHNALLSSISNLVITFFRNVWQSQF